jgi:uncharacterized spore protein YtfJ
MEIDEVITRAQDALSARRVYGEPYEQDGITVIPAAAIRGGGGGRDGEREDRRGSGAGFGLQARPVGAFVIRDGEVSWRPAVDATRIALGGQLVAIAALLVVYALLRRR